MYLLYCNDPKLDNQTFIYYHSEYFSKQNIVFSSPDFLTLWPTCSFPMVAVAAVMYHPVPPLQEEACISPATYHMTKSWVLSGNFPGLEAATNVTTPYRVHPHLVDTGWKTWFKVSLQGWFKISLIQDISAGLSAPELPMRLAESFIVASLPFSSSGFLHSLVVLFPEQTPKNPLSCKSVSESVFWGTWPKRNEYM